MNYIITFLIAMVPLVELRGAVPYAIATGIPMWQLYYRGCRQYASRPNYLLLRTSCA